MACCGIRRSEERRSTPSAFQAMCMGSHLRAKPCAWEAICAAQRPSAFKEQGQGHEGGAGAMRARGVMQRERERERERSPDER
jgi:hypothetical protein